MKWFTDGWFWKPKQEKPPVVYWNTTTNGIVDSGSYEGLLIRIRLSPFNSRYMADILMDNGWTELVKGALLEKDYRVMHEIRLIREEVERILNRGDR